MSFAVHIDSTSERDTKVLIEGDLRVKDTIEIKTRLLELLKEHSSAQIYLQNVTDIDVAALQLLLVLKQTAAITRKTFQFHFEDTPYLQNILLLSGYYQLFQN